MDLNTWRALPETINSPAPALHTGRAKGEDDEPLLYIATNVNTWGEPQPNACVHLTIEQAQQLATNIVEWLNEQGAEQVRTLHNKDGN